MSSDTFTLVELMEERRKAMECEMCKSKKPEANYKYCDRCKEKDAKKNFQNLRDSISTNIQNFQVSGNNRQYNELRRAYEKDGHKFNKDGTLK